MAKPEWGLKRTCLSCGARFYDMQRDPIVCPTCETEFDPLALVRPRRARAAAAASQAKAKAEAEKKPAEETSEQSGDDLLVDDGMHMDNDDIDLGEDDENLISDDDEDETDDGQVVSDALSNTKEEDSDRVS